MNHEVLLVSQFTLYGRMKGTKPDFSQAMSFEEVQTEMFIDFFVVISTHRVLNFSHFCIGKRNVFRICRSDEKELSRL